MEKSTSAKNDDKARKRICKVCGRDIIYHGLDKIEEKKVICTKCELEKKQ